MAQYLEETVFEGYSIGRGQYLEGKIFGGGSTAIAALRVNFWDTAIRVSFFQKVLRPFLAMFWVSRGSVVTIKIILV